MRIQNVRKYFFKYIQCYQWIRIVTCSISIYSTSSVQRTLYAINWKRWRQYFICCLFLDKFESVTSEHTAHLSFTHSVSLLFFQWKICRLSYVHNNTRTKATSPHLEHWIGLLSVWNEAFLQFGKQFVAIGLCNPLTFHKNDENNVSLFSSSIFPHMQCKATRTWYFVTTNRVIFSNWNIKFKKNAQKMKEMLWHRIIVISRKFYNIF